MTNPEKEKALENPETKAFVELFRKYPEAVAYLLKGFMTISFSLKKKMSLKPKEPEPLQQSFLIHIAEI